MLEVMVKAAKAGGAVARERQRRGFGVSIKGDGSPVTDADREAEAAVFAGARSGVSRLRVVGGGDGGAWDHGAAVHRGSDRWDAELCEGAAAVGHARGSGGGWRGDGGRGVSAGHRSASRGAARGGGLCQRRAASRLDGGESRPWHAAARLAQHLAPGADLGGLSPLGGCHPVSARVRRLSVVHHGGGRQGRGRPHPGREALGSRRAAASSWRRPAAPSPISRASPPSTRPPRSPPTGVCTRTLSPASEETRHDARHRARHPRRHHPPRHHGGQHPARAGPARSPGHRQPAPHQDP